MTTIALVGSGKIVGNLARKWAAQGHAITFGARSTDKLELVQLALDIVADRASVEDAVERSSVVVFAIPGGLRPKRLRCSARVSTAKS